MKTPSSRQRPRHPTPGPAGRLAARFLSSEITPLLALCGLLLGVFAVLVTPREEEPQINVTFANVFLADPGASASEVARTITTPAERIVSEISGIKHIYSASRPGQALLTVEFKVGEKRNDAIVRLYNALYSNMDRLPPGTALPLIKPKGIDDVPILAVTLWSETPAVGAEQLGRVAHALEAELQRVPGARNVDTIGAPETVLQVRPDPRKLAARGLDIDALSRALTAADTAREAGNLVSDNHTIQLRAGTFLSTPAQVANLVVGVNRGAPVYLRDVAGIREGPERPVDYVTFAATGHQDTAVTPRPAVTIEVSKKPGENAVVVADRLESRLRALQGSDIPDGVHYTLTRNYGRTADDKAGTLMHKLIFATASVVLLVLLTLGRRQAVVVGAAVIVTLATTLFASWAWGFTLNRVSLFALIFSIGILVDDAIVVVENIHRHTRLGGRPLDEVIPLAVDEVGGPTFLATLTVIAALLPMAFVSGLMGPYMAPIPINASLGMLISLAVAFVFTPWLYRRLFVNVRHDAVSHGEEVTAGRMERLFHNLMGPFLRGRRGRPARLALLAGILLLITGSVALVGMRLVVLKMLPFDNKSEFQVVVDMPEGTTLEQTNRVLDALGGYLAGVPEVTDYELYAGTASPINFNGLVRQYYLRDQPWQGDIQVNLVDKGQRDRQSHEIALAVRGPLQAIARRFDANVKIVEVPPGPPVLSPLVAEIYGPDYAGQIRAARVVRRVLAHTPDIVDVDDDIEAPQARRVAVIDRPRAALLGVAPSAIVDTLEAAAGGKDVARLHVPDSTYPVPIRLRLGEADQADPALAGRLTVNAADGTPVPLSAVVHWRRGTRQQTLYHKDLLPVMYVTADMAGPLDSPLYGMIRAQRTLAHTKVDGRPLATWYINQPATADTWSLKWDGEWQITYETFRDMGLAYSVGLILIYLLVVAQFRSYSLPLIIMAPIPLTLIGILPGHALLGRQFTATSMIGMIALAGIIVRNSILLVDFLIQARAAGRRLEDAVVEAAAVRARPILLTALAATLGAFFILDDPIFSGLAVALIFGIAVSTVLTLLVIPVVYYAYHYRGEESAGD